MLPIFFNSSCYYSNFVNIEFLGPNFFLYFVCFVFCRNVFLDTRSLTLAQKMFLDCIQRFNPLFLQPSLSRHPNVTVTSRKRHSDVASPTRRFFIVNRLSQVVIYIFRMFKTSDQTNKFVLVCKCFIWSFHGFICS